MSKNIRVAGFFFLFYITTNKSRKCNTIFMKLNKTKTFRISETQLKTLQKMKSLNVDVGRFIREAIREKIQREYSDLLPKKKKYAFMVSLENAISKQQNYN